MSNRLPHAEIRERLTGHVASLRTPFTMDGEIDFDGLQKHIDFIIEAGSKTVILTFGDSLFSALRTSEIAEVTKRVNDHVRGRAMVCAATGIWSTPETVDFASYCREIGVDILMVLPPDWAQSLTIDTLVDHYQAAAQVMPVMMVTNIFLPRGEAWGLKAVEAVRDRVPGVAAVKDDFCNEFGRRLSMLTYGTWAVFTGGQKRNHLSAHFYGCDGYMSTFLTFKPEVAREYWQAVQSKDYQKATHIIETYEVPLFDHLKSINGGFDAGLHGIYELIGIYKRWRRPPYHSLTDEQMSELRAVCERLSII